MPDQVLQTMKPQAREELPLALARGDGGDGGCVQCLLNYTGVGKSRFTDVHTENNAIINK